MFGQQNMLLILLGCNLLLAINASGNTNKKQQQQNQGRQSQTKAQRSPIHKRCGEIFNANLGQF